VNLRPEMTLAGNSWKEKTFFAAAKPLNRLVLIHRKML